LYQNLKFWVKSFTINKGNSETAPYRIGSWGIFWDGRKQDKRLEGFFNETVEAIVPSGRKEKE